MFLDFLFPLLLLLLPLLLSHIYLFASVSIRPLLSDGNDCFHFSSSSSSSYSFPTGTVYKRTREIAIAIAISIADAFAVARETNQTIDHLLPSESDVSK